MSVELNNPYCTLEELQRELRRPVDPADKQRDALHEAINRASRYVDDHQNRDYLMHDYRVSPLTVSEYDEEEYGDTVYFRYRPAIVIDSVLLAGAALVVNSDYVVKDDKLIRLGGVHWELSTPSNLLQIYGLFGKLQPFNRTFTPTSGEAAITVSSLSLDYPATTTDHRTLYWNITKTGDTFTFTVATAADGTGSICSGTVDAADGESASVALAELNSSGISGTAVFTATGVGSSHAWSANNKGVLLATTIDATKVPTGVPETIKTATLLVAAALSGFNRKEVVGLDGTKTEVISTEIPKTVDRLLGKRAKVIL